MVDNTYLCPCCAAHLCVPQTLNVMRCNNCHAELTYINDGGVRGLALLPQLESAVPYSHPAQRGHQTFDGSELLHLRREVLLKSATRRHRFWSVCFFASVAVLLSVAGAGLAGAEHIVQKNRDAMEWAAGAFLLAVAFTPIVAYVALYFQGRARLERESIQRSLRP